MAAKSGSKPSSLRLFLERYYKLASKLCYCEGYVKNNVGRDRRSNVVILECFVCRWEGGEVGKV